MQTRLVRIFLILTILTFFNPVLLQAATEKRTALVVGNSAYSSGPLMNPANDATNMMAILQQTDFSFFR